MYRSMDMTGASASASAVGAADCACAESGFVSWLEAWVNEGFVVWVNWDVASLEWRCMLKVRIAGPGQLSKLCWECGNSTGLHEVRVMWPWGVPLTATWFTLNGLHTGFSATIFIYVPLFPTTPPIPSSLNSDSCLEMHWQAGWPEVWTLL